MQSQNPVVHLLYFAAFSCFAVLFVSNTAQAQIPVEIDCVIYPSLVADLGSSATGMLNEVHVDKGDTVSAGDEIAVLESSAEIAALQLARIRAASTADLDLQKTNIAFAERRQQRAQNLVQQKLISDSQVDEYETETRIGQVQLQRAKEEAEIAKIELLRAEALLSRRTIRSPFDGVILERYTNVGELVEEKPVVRVAMLNPLHVEVIVPASQFSQLEIGLQAEVRIADSDGITWIAAINRIDPVADIASDTYGVQLELPNPDYTVPAGRRCLVRFLETQKPPEMNTDLNPDKSDETLVSDEKPVTHVAIQHLATPDLGAAVQLMEPDLKTGRNFPKEQHHLTELAETECRWAGPFSELAGARSAQKDLMKNEFGAVLVEHSAEKVRGMLVVSKLQSSRSDAEKLLEKLKASGYADAYLPSRLTARRVSLGAFDNPVNAEQLRGSLSTLGIEAELSPWNQRIKQYYLAVHSQNPTGLSKSKVQVPQLKNTIPLRNADGTFRDTACDSYIKQ